MTVRIVSWNLNLRAMAKRLDLILGHLRAMEPDVVCLQEVPCRHAAALADGLAGLGLTSMQRSWDEAPAGPEGRKNYGCIVASRWHVTRTPDTWRAAAPFPELLQRVSVDIPACAKPADATPPDAPGTVAMEVFHAHIPNGSGHGWKKIDTFNVLSAALRRAGDMPRVLCGDFNEPRHIRSSGQVVTFGEDRHPDGGTSSPAWKDQSGDERPGLEWTRGVRSVLAGESQHGLRDAYRDHHGFHVMPVTYVTSHGNRRCFDHALVSRHLAVQDAGYRHSARHDGVSDHSPLWVALEFREDLPPLVAWDEPRPAG